MPFCFTASHSHLNLLTNYIVLSLSLNKHFDLLVVDLLLSLFLLVFVV